MRHGRSLGFLAPYLQGNKHEQCGVKLESMPVLAAQQRKFV